MQANLLTCQVACHIFTSQYAIPGHIPLRTFKLISMALRVTIKAAPDEEI